MRAQISAATRRRLEKVWMRLQRQSDEAIDAGIRAVAIVSPPGGGGATDHGALTGLADNDHPQYTTDAEAGVIAEAAVTAHEGEANPHPTYATDADLVAHAGAGDPHAGYVLESLVDAAGDLIVGSAADTVARLAKGADGTVLTVDPTTHLLIWATPTGGGGLSFDDGATPSNLGAGALTGDDASPSRRDHVHLNPVILHEALSDPHPDYTKDAEATALAEAAIVTHAAAGNPHGGYQLESEKGAASGYASLGADTLVPQDQLGTGTQDGTRFLRDDGTWQAVSAGSITVREVDGTPSVTATVLELPNGTLTDEGGGVARYAAAGGSALTVQEIDGAPLNNAVTIIRVTNGKLTDNGAGDVTLDLSGGGLPGYVPYAHVWGARVSETYGTAAALAANGGSFAAPIYVPGYLKLYGVRIRNLDTATARSCEWRLYRDDFTGATLSEIANANGTLSFTPTVASNRDSALATAVLLPPACYWIVIRNTHATSTFGLATFAGAGLAPFIAQTKTLGSGLGATLDFTAATWTKSAALCAVVLNGAAFGETAQF